MSCGIKLLVGVSLLFIAGCGRPTIIREPIEVPIARYEPVPVPEALLSACKVDLSALKNNQDLEAALAAALVELRRCTEDKNEIRELTDDVQVH